jgi:hypothetical protein
MSAFVPLATRAWCSRCVPMTRVASARSGSQGPSSCVASCCMCCPRASSAFATTGCWQQAARRKKLAAGQGWLSICQQSNVTSPWSQPRTFMSRVAAMDVQACAGAARRGGCGWWGCCWGRRTCPAHTLPTHRPIGGRHDGMRVWSGLWGNAPHGCGGKAAPPVSQRMCSMPGGWRWQSVGAVFLQLAHPVAHGAALHSAIIIQHDGVRSFQSPCRHRP